MKTTTTISRLACVILLSALLLPNPPKSLAETQIEKIQREADESKTERIREDLQRRDTTIRFFGKVVDQEKQPVSDAEVFLHIQKYSPNISSLFGQIKKLQTKTDTYGFFSVSDEKGRGLYVENIHKDGFEFSWKQNSELGFEYDASNGREHHVPDPAKPVVFRLRKKLSTEVILLKNVLFEIKLPAGSSGCTYGYDLVERYQIPNLNHLELNYQPVVPDFLLKASLNTNDGRWTVTFFAGNTNGGILATSQLLYEAPEGGYQPEYTFCPTNDPQRKAVLRFFIRSREPAIYTRVDLTRIRVERGECLLEGTSWVNPYGDRNLEEAVGLPSGIYVRLQNEAEENLRFGKRPIRPDLPKLIKEAKDKGN